MVSLIRLVGLLNAAIWFGSAVFLTVGAAPAFFSDDMKALLGPAFPAYSGALVQVMFKRFFLLQYVCGLIATFHLLLEWIYMGRPFDRLSIGLVAIVLSFNLLGGLWMQPKLKSLHTIKYARNTTPAQKEQAAQSLKVWHAISQTSNLLILGGLFAYYWQIVNRPLPTRLTRQFVPPV